MRPAVGQRLGNLSLGSVVWFARRDPFESVRNGGTVVVHFDWIKDKLPPWHDIGGCDVPGHPEMFDHHHPRERVRYAARQTAWQHNRLLGQAKHRVKGRIKAHTFTWKVNERIYFLD